MNKLKCVIKWEKEEDLKRKERLEIKLKEREYKITIFNYFKEGENIISYMTSELESKEFYWKIRNQKRLQIANATYLIENKKFFVEDVTDYEQKEIIKELIKKIDNVK